MLRLIVLCATWVALGVSHSLARADEPRGTVGLRQLIEATLQRNVNVRLAQANVDIAQGAARIQRGAFDIFGNASVNTTSSSQPSTPFDISNNAAAPETRSRFTDTRYTLSTQLRNGLRISSSVTQNISTVSPDTSAGLVNPAGTVSFTLSLPLLRGGMGTASMPLRISELEAGATRNDLEATVAQSLLFTTVRYWAYLAAVRRLDILRYSEQRTVDLLQQLEILVKANEVPRAELDLLRANLNERRSNRALAEQGELAAKLGLARAVGLGADEASLLALPADDFPRELRDIDRQLSQGVQALGQLAVQRRHEFAALARREESARLGVDLARNSALPQLDLNAGTGRSGIGETSGRPSFPYRSAFDTLGATGHSVGVTLAYPFGNNVAQGTIAQRSALLQQNSFQRVELIAQVQSNVEQAVFGIRSNRSSIERLMDARRAYEIALDNEKLKQRLGLSTLIDVINVEDRLNNASIALVQAQADHASSVAQLLFETAQLLDIQGDTYSANVGALLGQ